MVEPGFKPGHSEAAEFTFLPAVRYCVSQPFVRNLFWQKCGIQRQCLVSQGIYTFVYTANHNVKNTQEMGQKLLYGLKKADNFCLEREGITLKGLTISLVF